MASIVDLVNAFRIDIMDFTTSDAVKEAFVDDESCYYTASESRGPSRSSDATSDSGFISAEEEQDEKTSSSSSPICFAEKPRCPGCTSPLPLPCPDCPLPTLLITEDRPFFVTPPPGFHYSLPAFHSPAETSSCDLPCCHPHVFDPTSEMPFWRL